MTVMFHVLGADDLDGVGKNSLSCKLTFIFLCVYFISIFLKNPWPVAITAMLNELSKACRPVCLPQSMHSKTVAIINPVKLLNKAN